MADYLDGLTNSSYLDWLNEYDTTLAAQSGARAGAPGTGQHLGRGNLAGVLELLDVPAGDVTDDIVQQTILAAVAKGTLPSDDLNTVYAIFFPQTVKVDSSCARTSDGFAGYHFTAGGTLEGPAYLVLAACSSTEAYYGGLVSHELVEAITDRVPTAGDIPDYPQAWNDKSAFELADICEDQPNLSISTGRGVFEAQSIWDELNGRCDALHLYPQDFSLSLAPNVGDLQAGQPLTASIVTATTSGSAQPLSLTVLAPPGISVTLDRQTLQSGDLATLTLTASPDAPVPRDAQVIVRATGTTGGVEQVHSASLLLQPPEFSLLVGKASGDLHPNESITVPITATALHGLVGPIALSAAGLPTGVTATFTPDSLPVAGTAVLELQAHAAAVATGATFRITAAGSTATHVATGVFNVVAAPSSGGCATGGLDASWLGLALLAMSRKRRR